MLESIIFGVFAGILLFSSGMVVFAREVIHSLLWLVLSFISAAALWVLLHAEFLGLLLILVYVGAVLTLFLFVIMTLSTTPLSNAAGGQYLSHYLLAFIITLIGLGSILYSLHSFTDSFTLQSPESLVAPFVKETSTQALGITLYTHFVYPFELVGVLLLTAIIVSISLHSGPHLLGAKNETQTLFQQDQLKVRREDRIRLVKGD